MPISDKGTLFVPLSLYDRILTLDGTCAGAELRFLVDDLECCLVLPKFDLGLGEVGRFTTTFGDLADFNKFKSVRPWNSTDFGRVMEQKKTGRGWEVKSFEARKVLVKVVTTGAPGNIVQLADHIDELIVQLIDWLDVLTFSYSVAGSEIQEFEFITPHYIDPLGNLITLKPVRPRLGFTVFDICGEPPTLEQLRIALSNSQKKRKADLVHTLLITALKHLFNSDFRGAVLDVSTAMEVALVRVFEQLVEDSAIAHPDKYLELFRPISRLLDEIEALSGEHVISKSDFQEYVGKARNKSIHSGQAINATDAERALRYAKEFIYRVIPPYGPQ